MDTAFESIEKIGDRVDAYNLLTIALILGVAAVTYAIGSRILDRAVHHDRGTRKHRLPHWEDQRRRTILSISKSAFGVLVWAVAGFNIFGTLGIPVAPLLAGAGIAGVALGFGAQTLVKDLIAGIFLISENHYRVGDVVRLGDISGVVEKVTLRITVLRDLDGIVHYIPNGVPETASNMSMGFSGVNIDVGVDYSSDLEHVIKVVNEVGEGMMAEEEWAEKILEKPEFLRVDNFGDSAIIIKIIGKTQPLEQWAVEGEYRKRLKIAFDKAGIVIPLPQRVLHQAAPALPAARGRRKEPAARPAVLK